MNKELFKEAVRKTWHEISADAEVGDVHDAIELILDADRLMTIGGVSKAEYKKMEAFDKAHPAEYDRLAFEALDPFFR